MKVKIKEYSKLNEIWIVAIESHYSIYLAYKNVIRIIMMDNFSIS